MSLVAILDADKEGFLRSERSLIQTIGRAARNSEGKVILYGDIITDSMKKAIDETARRRRIQMAYNEEHHITPQTIRKDIRDVIEATKAVEEEKKLYRERPEFTNEKSKERYIKQLEKEMQKAAKELEFEKAALLRDSIMELRGEK